MIGAGECSPVAEVLFKTVEYAAFPVVADVPAGFAPENVTFLELLEELPEELLEELLEDESEDGLTACC